MILRALAAFWAYQRARLPSKRDVAIITLTALAVVLLSAILPGDWSWRDDALLTTMVAGVSACVAPEIVGDVRRWIAHRWTTRSGP